MADDRRLTHRALSDRELLLLIVDRVEIALPAIVKEQDEQRKDIRDLLRFRYYTAGAIAALLALFGIHHGG